MFQTPANKNAPASWKTRTYAVGIIGGIALGLLAAYMYTRAAEDDTSRTGRAARIQTGDLLGLGLALLGILRQVAEMGRAPESDRKKR